MRARLLCALLALAFAACSGGNAAIPRAPGSPSHLKIKITFKVSVPSGRHRGKHARRISARLKHIWSTAANTAGIEVTAYAAGDRTTPLGQVVADISASSANCTPITSSSSYGGRSCSFALQAVPGNDDFVATTYDSVSCSGNACSIPSSAKQLGYGVTTQTITAGTSPSVSLAVAAVLSKLQFGLTPGVLHTLVPSTATVNVYALDADDDVIVSSGFIDANGNTVHVTFTADNTLPLVGSSTASLAFSPTAISGPQSAGVTLTYAPTANGVVAPASQTVHISATTDAPSVTVTGATLQAVAPSYAAITDTNLNASNAGNHGGIAFDTSGGAYYATNKSFGGASYYNGSGATVSDNYAVGSAPALIGGVGSNGATFYAITGTTMDQFGTPPSTTFGAVPNSFGAPGSNGSALTYDTSRSVLFYASGTNLVEYSPFSGGPATFAIGTTTIGGIVLDSSNNIWIVDTPNNKLLKEDTVNPVSSFSLQSGGAAFDVADQTTQGGSKERLFVTDHGASPAILELNTSGTLLTTNALPSGAVPRYIAKDTSQPGIVWFDYISGSQIGIGRLDMTGSTPKFLLANGPSVAGGQAGAIGTASDGHIYTVFDNAQELVEWSR